MRDIVHVQQPPGSSLCGHSVLAMCLGCGLAGGIARMGHERSTRTRELVAALSGLALDSRLRVRGARPVSSLPDPCVLKVRWKKGSHYVLRAGDSVHDPASPIPLDLRFWEEWVAVMMGRITSFLPVRLSDSLIGA